LRGDFGLGLLNAWYQTAGVQSCEHLPGMHLSAFIDQHFCDALAVVEGKIDLPQIDVAMQRNHRTVAVAMQKPDEQDGGDDNRSPNRDDLLVHDGIFLVRCLQVQRILFKIKFELQVGTGADVEDC